MGDSDSRVMSPEMVRRFRKMPTARDERLAEAVLIADSDERVGELARCLEASVVDFDKRYGACTEPFHPARVVQTGRNLALGRADNLGLRLSGVWAVEGDEQLDFVYLDREVPVAHRKAHPRIDDDVTVDLLLANVHDGTPIIGEVKRADPKNAKNVDADPYYALMQSLAAVSMLATPSQLARLRAHARSEFALSLEPRLDIYLLALNPTVATNIGKLAEVVGEIARKLLARQGATGPLRRIAYLDVTETARRTLDITRRWVHNSGPTQTTSPTPPDPPAL